ncbi:MAG: transglycosylase domain-containing protein, partial [Roseiarcus sp.]
MSEGREQSRFRKTVARLLLAFDSFVDSSMYDGQRRAIRTLQAIGALSDRFRLAGLGKFAVEFACEGLNVGIVGLIFALALAQPAFRDTSDEDWLKRTDLAVTFLDRYGAEVGRRGIKHDDAIPFDELPDHFIKAVLATEDRRFFSHFGIDVIGTLRALTVNAHAGGVVQGGSSITQQLAKNVFLTNERSISRKIKEAYLALWLEHHLTKKQILSLYLDRAYMGGGAFGVQAAAQYYFGKSARDINLAEAAMLAGLFKAPTKYSPNVNLPAARARANDVLSNLVDAGFMTEGQVYAARRNPATPVDHTEHGSPDWYLDFAYNEVKALAEEGKLGDDRVLVVRTGLDSNLQLKAEGVIEDELRVNAPAFHAHQAATVVAETNGLVRAIVGGRDYGASQFNRATDALRQPGSSFKIFVYLTALMTGKYHAATPIDASSICIGDYCVHNYDGESGGAMPLYRALALSFNTAAIRLSVKIGEAYWPPKQSYHLAKIATLGRAKIVETARAMGLTTPLTDTVSLPVGADEVKMIDMVGANAILANGGKRVTPYAAIEIRNSSGALIYSHDVNGPRPVQVMPADKIAEMNNIMTHVVTEGTGRAAQIPGLVISGKTGTTNNSTNAWFNGFTGNLVCSVWFGNDDNTGMQKMTGGELPAQSWKQIMAYAHQGLETKPPFGVAAPAPGAVAQISSAPVAKTGAGIVEVTPRGLAPRSTQIILEIGELARTARNRLAAADPPIVRSTQANA